MELVDKENDPAFSADHLVEDRFETLFKFAPELGSGDEGAHIQTDQLAVFQVFGDIPSDDTPCQTFGDGSFAHTGFADEDRVVLGAPGKDLDHTADLIVTSDDRIQFILHGKESQIFGVFFQRLKGPFRVRRGDTLGAPDGLERLQNLFAVDTGVVEQFLGSGTGTVENTHEKVFHADVLVVHLFSLFSRPGQDRRKLP